MNGQTRVEVDPDSLKIPVKDYLLHGATIKSGVLLPMQRPSRSTRCFIRLWWESLIVLGMIRYIKELSMELSNNVRVECSG